MSLRKHIPAALLGLVLGLLAAMLAATLAVLLGGCQTVTEIEYYEPTAQNSAYCTPTGDKTQGHGPVKSVRGKSGSPDFSDGKSFNFNLSVLGL